jgi:hypothetical protein
MPMTGFKHLFGNIVFDSVLAESVTPLQPSGPQVIGFLCH